MIKINLLDEDVQRIAELYEVAIKNVQEKKINYNDWNLYYNLLLKTLHFQLSEIKYRELAIALADAEVVMCKSNKEQETIKNRQGQLAADIMAAKKLSANGQSDFNYELEQALALSAAIKDLSTVAKKDLKDNEFAYIGKDGKDYYSFEALREADEVNMKFMFPKIDDKFEQTLMTVERSRTNRR